MQNLQQRTGALLLDAHTQELRRIARADKNYWPGKALSTGLAMGEVKSEVEKTIRALEG